MHRRTVLAAVSAVLAGCGGKTVQRDSTTGTPTSTTAGRVTTATAEAATRTHTETTTHSSTDSTTDPATDSTTDPPADPTTENPVDFALLPASPDSMTTDEVRRLLETTACSELADSTVVCPDDDARLDVSRSDSVRPLPRGTVDVTVRNASSESFRWNPYDWELSKYDGERWRRIAPLSIPAPMYRFEPNESHTFHVTADNTRFHGTESYMTNDQITLSGLGPGIYALTTDGYFESTPDATVVVAATFGFSGEGEPVRPTDGVGDLDREGSTLVVRANDRGDANGKRTLVVSFIDATPEARLLPEHVLQVAGLRNTLSYAATEGVSSIRYVTSEDTVNTAMKYLKAVGPADATAFRFREHVFEASKEYPSY